METIIKPMTKEAIAITEKKLSMTLDEIIKMSKKASLKKAASRPKVGSRGSVGAPLAKYSKAHSFLNCRSSLRKKSSNLGEKHCALTSEALANAAIASTSRKKNFMRKSRNGNGFRYPRQNVVTIRAAAEETLRKNGWNTRMKKKTLDARFADLKFGRPMQALRHQLPVPTVNLQQFSFKQSRRGPIYDYGSNYLAKNRLSYNWS